MRRNGGSLFATHLPVLKRERVGCYNWGLVNGKTQTHFPWGSPKGAAEPKLWFHDIFRRDGTPYDPEEIRVIRKAFQTPAGAGRRGSDYLAARGRGEGPGEGFGRSVGAAGRVASGARGQARCRRALVHEPHLALSGST